MRPRHSQQGTVILSEAKNLSLSGAETMAPPPARLLGAPVIRLRTVVSTMDIARDLAMLGAAEGTAVIAGTQTHGRGRAGRAWQSPPGAGLYVSILLRPTIEATAFAAFSVAAGLALADALDPDETAGIELKWPNDLIAGGRKLAGILVAASSTGSHVDTAIIGIGLNVLPAAGRPETSISLTQIGGIRAELVQDPFPAIADSLSATYRQILANEIDLALIRWPSRLAFLNQSVTLEDSGQRWNGTLRGIDPAAALLLETESGIQTFHAGDLTRGPRSVSVA